LIDKEGNIINKKGEIIFKKALLSADGELPPPFLYEKYKRAFLKEMANEFK